MLLKLTDKCLVSLIQSRNSNRLTQYLKEITFLEKYEVKGRSYFNDSIKHYQINKKRFSSSYPQVINNPFIESLRQVMR